MRSFAGLYLRLTTNKLRSLSITLLHYCSSYHMLLNVSFGHDDNEINTDFMRVGAQEYKMKAGENE